MQIEKSENSDLNHYHSDSNPNSSKFAWRLWFESLFNGFEFELQKRSEWLLDERVIRIPIKRIRIQIPVRSTLMDWFESHSSDSNPWWRKKWSWKPWIRITYTTIWIPHEEQVKRLKHGFESPTQWFESMNLELWRIRQGDSNLWVMNLNPLTNWSWGLKVGQSDSNLWVMDSNHSLAQNSNIAKAIQIIHIAIRILHSAEAFIALLAVATTRLFNSNLFHNG